MNNIFDEIIKEVREENKFLKIAKNKSMINVYKNEILAFLYLRNISSLFYYYSQDIKYYIKNFFNNIDGKVQFLDKSISCNVANKIEKMIDFKNISEIFFLDDYEFKHIKIKYINGEVYYLSTKS